MSLIKIPPHMIQELPGELIPELVDAREGYETLLQHLQHLKQIIDAINQAIAEGQLGVIDGVITGTITFEGGAIIPANSTLRVDGTTQLSGTTNLDGGVSSVSQVPTEGQFGVNAVVAHVREYPIQGVGVNTILSFTPSINANFLIYVYVRVNEYTPQVTLTIQYTDAGGTQEHLVLNNVIQSRNSYSVAPIFINAMANQPIIVNGSSNVADQVFISASIVGL